MTAEIEVFYTDPLEETTPRKSKAWYDLRASYMAYEIEIEIANETVSLADVGRNPKDGGSWRWDTPLFESEVDKLVNSVKSTGKFEAVWLRKDGKTYSILDGHHRVVAWKKMGNSAIPAVVVAVKPFASQL